MLDLLGFFSQKVINFDFLVESGMMDAAEYEDMFITDDPQEAFMYLRDTFVSGKLLVGSKNKHKSFARSSNPST